MEHLPVEVIGSILSHLGSANDVVNASATCKKWREARLHHLCILSFNSHDWPNYHELTSNRLEIFITLTILQTKALQCLTISMDDVHEFSAATVIAWLMYTRDSLRQLYYNIRTTPNLNIIEICGRQKLEVLALARNSITGVEPSYTKFPCLKSLSLSFISISALDLSLLLSACPRLEILSMVSLETAVSDSHTSMVLKSSSLKDVYIESVGLDKFYLDADFLENLHLKDCAFDLFELIGEGTLKVFKVDNMSAIVLDLGDNFENLEIVDVSNFTWPKFHHLISYASKLHRLRLWGVVYEDEDDFVELDAISEYFPQLTHLSLSYDLRDGINYYGLQGLSLMVNVVVLELGWTSISNLFSEWVAGLMERCPNLKKLIIYGLVSEVKTHEECQIFARFTEFMLQLGREYMDVKIQFEYE